MSSYEVPDDAPASFVAGCRGRRPLLAAACGDDGGAAGRAARRGSSSPPASSATWSRNLVGDDGRASRSLMPPGADPHEFQRLRPPGRRPAGRRPGRRQRRRASRRASTTRSTAPRTTDVRHRRSGRSTMPPTVPGDDVDPHFFTDPARMADAAEALADVAGRGGARPRHRRLPRAGRRLRRRAARRSTPRSRPPSRRSRPSAACWSPTTTCSPTSPTATASRSSASVIPGGTHPGRAERRRAGRPGRATVEAAGVPADLRRHLLARAAGRRPGRRGRRRRGRRAVQRVARASRAPTGTTYLGDDAHQRRSGSPPRSG